MHTPPTNKIRWWTPITICPLSIAIGILFGALTNAINANVSPEYFELVMRWSAPAATEWQWTIEQGVLEGGIIGLIFGVVFSLAICASTMLRCPLPFAIGYLARGLTIVFVCWFAGGLVGVALAQFIPSLWGSVFIHVPSNVSLLRFAWVGGTIDGAYLGALVALIVLSIIFHLRWRKMIKSSLPTGFHVIQVIPNDQSL